MFCILFLLPSVVVLVVEFVPCPSTYSDYAYLLLFSFCVGGCCLVGGCAVATPPHTPPP